jgi:hypothetical protein
MDAAAVVTDGEPLTILKVHEEHLLQPHAGSRSRFFAGT